MQHTNKYKFNIIEADDPFSPDALNENTRAIEAALAKCGDCRVYMGSYIGWGGYGASDKNSITLPFEPKLLFMDVLGQYTGGGHVIWARGGVNYYSVNTMNAKFTVSWSGKTVTWYTSAVGSDAPGYQLNIAGRTYHYIAIG